jgi:membrane-associated phospholipid phosphatase
MPSLLDYDFILFSKIHTEWHNSIADTIIPFIRNQYFWAPLYIFILAFMYFNYGIKGLRWCLFFFITFAIADFVSASILKPYFARVRPCNDANWFGYIRPLVPLSRGYSFPSSHASNHFGLSVFIITTLSRYYKYIIPASLLWAGSIAYAQVYVGVHYPLDVLAGALLGTWVGYLCGNYFNLRWQL